jgi:hypothetical protein
MFELAGPAEFMTLEQFKMQPGVVVLQIKPVTQEQVVVEGDLEIVLAKSEQLMAQCLRAGTQLKLVGQGQVVPSRDRLLATLALPVQLK